MFKTACTKIVGVFLENRSDSVHKYGHVVLRVLSTLCTLKGSYTMPIQAFELAANESNEPYKAKLELKVSVKENEVPTEKNSIRASIFATKTSYISN